MREWIYPTKNVREEYNRAVTVQKDINQLYADIEDLERQIKFKRGEIKNKSENEPKYTMFFFREMINMSQEDLMEDIKRVQRYIAFSENPFQSARLQTLKDLLATLLGGAKSKTDQLTTVKNNLHIYKE